MNLKLSAPLFAQIELTERCNHSCHYCYNRFFNSSGDMPKKKIRRVLQQIEANKIFSVVLTGGEPFMNRKGLSFAIDYLKDKPIDVYINTNLSIPLSNEDLKMLKNSNSLLVSFPSYKEEIFNEVVGKDSYSTNLKNLEKLVSEDIKFSINQVVTQKNKEDVYMTGKFLFENFNVCLFSASPVVPVRKKDLKYGLDKEEILEVARDLLKLEREIPIKSDMLECIPPCLFPEDIRWHPMARHGCSAGKEMAVISVSGKVRRCTKLEEDYGNIYNEDLSKIWHRINNIKKPENNLCDGCTASRGCYSGCEIRAVMEGKDPLVCGSKNYHEKIIYKKMERNKTYRISNIRWREEEESLLIIEDGGSFVFGNKMLLRFLNNLKDKNFTLEEVSEKYGQKAENVLNYLYNKEIVKNGI